MDTLESYRQIIQSVLTDYAAIPIANGKIDCYTVFDTKQDHYNRKHKPICLKHCL
ncbi:MAG: element excision factor XisI family protein [Coleofasciculus chthonoplastes F3-SA18-01]|jgi:hypothetical protein|uniref:element excision factor XisI family protein n=1 Tax=Coleofasciculus chthonoplastes TaxID=64178 RepID=UPI0032FBC26F